MNKQELVKLINQKRSFLCVGLDPDVQKLPKHLLNSDDPVFEFNKQIIDATKEFAVAYKPNLAFYECLGIKGMQSFEKTIRYLNKFPGEFFTIADAKRGDIGNTSKMYARSFFGNEENALNFDAVTVAPYMGEDSVKPFLEYPNKWVILLALTSNKGANDFQFFNNNGKRLFEQVLERSQQWANSENMMYVVGATQAKMLADIRKIVPDHFLLVPGVGAQGGSLQEVVKYGMNKEIGLLINASRSILYASANEDFAVKAADEAKVMRDEMSALMK
ncbi:MAG TPA: orotidine-5'-phosphate decarboxylase [Bacteroidales bacterium]|nr:orotidine-5'-phosphate decarboxylase [Bacteroidales bacterium]HPS18363.1 orotidine-5'-phosphate decarboxylase [Bacteroidales bacterium]